MSNETLKKYYLDLIKTHDSWTWSEDRTHMIRIFSFIVYLKFYWFRSNKLINILIKIK
jgi:hypothetical protein